MFVLVDVVLLFGFDPGAFVCCYFGCLDLKPVLALFGLTFSGLFVVSVEKNFGWVYSWFWVWSLVLRGFGF